HAGRFHLPCRNRYGRPHQPAPERTHCLSQRCATAGSKQRLEKRMNVATKPARAYDWAAFRSEIDGIRVYDDPKQVELRSRDYFWYSPILSEDIGHFVGDLVVIPADEDQVRRVAAAAAKLRIPITIRGGGTGNYGQCVPLEGGIILDMTKIDKVLSIESGRVRVQAGARISRLDDAVRETGQELLMYPSTRRSEERRAGK